MHWARISSRKTGRGPDEAADDLASFGIEGEVRDALDADESEPQFPIWRENMLTVALFTMHCATQWRVAAMGGRISLNYPGVDIVLRRRRVKNSNQVFEDLQVMERAALLILNEPRDD